MNYAALFDELEVSSWARGTPPPEAVPDGLSELSPEQLEALCAPLDESAVICAGAGAGKTRLLVKRVAALLKKGVAARDVAVVTFTRKAAAELKARVQKEVGAKAKDLVCATVHARAYAHAVKHHLVLNLVEDDQLLELVEPLKMTLPKELESLNSRELLLLVSRYREMRRPLANEQALATAFEAVLTQAGVDDFTAVLSKAMALPPAGFRHVLVDEAQDLSELQLQFLRQHAPSAHFWFIGDADQAIYGFRGAHASMMHQLKLDCSGSYVLRRNYRSARLIVHHALQVIKHNTERFDINWVPMTSAQGSVEVLAFESGDAELHAARDWLQAAAPGHRCVVARTQALVAPLKEQGLMACSIHESKGLEWPEVWVLGCESSVMPHPLGSRTEERRLCYVAMTRAKQALVMSYAETRVLANKKVSSRQPSVFLLEAQGLG